MWLLFVTLSPKRATLRAGLSRLAAVMREKYAWDVVGRRRWTRKWRSRRWRAGAARRGRPGSDGERPGSDGERPGSDGGRPEEKGVALFEHDEQHAPTATTPAGCRGGGFCPGTGFTGRPRRSGVGVVVVDPLPLFRAGAVAALSAGGARVLGEASHLDVGVLLARSTRAAALLLGGATVDEVREAVAALPSCAVVVLLAQPSRTELMEVLGAGVAGLALRSITAEELVSTVEAAAEGVAGAGSAPGAPAPVFVPLLVGLKPVGVAIAGGGAQEDGTAVLTPKEREILAELAQGSSNKRIAEALYVTPATVKTHLAHIYAKLGARGRHEALTHALAMGLLH